jgi:hypothetical protein
LAEDLRTGSIPPASTIRLWRLRRSLMPDHISAGRMPEQVDGNFPSRSIPEKVYQSILLQPEVRR